MTALVTGASAGLGAEFARQLADRGHDLVLVARDEARLAAARERLQRAHGVSVTTLPADLTTDAGCDAVATRLGDDAAPVDVLVNNAGIGTYRRFGVATLADEERQLDLNVRAVLRLTHASVAAMTARGHGRIVNVSSVSAFVPRANNASYAASKAWVSLFSEALALQVAGTGVSVTAVCPGFVRTEFHERAGADMSGVPGWLWLDAPAVVRAALAAAEQSKAVSVPTLRYRALVAAARLVPRPALRRFMARRRY